MSAKPPSWCARCRAAHISECPHRPVWVKAAFVKSGRGGRAWRREREKVFERDKYLCQIHLAKGELVGVALHGVDAGICDHKIPLAEGGSDDVTNKQTICKQCDKEKTARESQRGRGR